MKVSAKCRINFNGTWHKAGDEFEVSDSEYKELSDIVEVKEAEPVKELPVEDFVSDIFTPTAEPVEAPRKRTRKKKTTE